jgi:hypothetical protein
MKLVATLLFGLLLSSAAQAAEYMEKRLFSYRELFRRA